MCLFTELWDSGDCICIGANSDAAEREKTVSGLGWHIGMEFSRTNSDWIHDM